MKNHLKRIAAPSTWIIDRRQEKFIIRPHAGAHSLELSLALGYILRDMLKLAFTMSEVKKILYSKTFLIDGKRQKDPRTMVGLFDVLFIPEIKEAYHLTLDGKGRLTLIKIDPKEGTSKPCQVVGKKTFKKNKIQLHFHDGKNILIAPDRVEERKVKIGDTLILSLPELKIQKILPLKPGSTVFLTKGKHAGDWGTVKEIKGKDATYIRKNQEIATSTKYLFVLNEKPPTLAINTSKT